MIGEVKDYIFRHFHDTIQITDIAKHLNVNPDYLSHLFKKQENITIKRYILKEKIRRSRNLLQYSDYSIQEISFYLGFSSQSHFCNLDRIVKMPKNIIFDLSNQRIFIPARLRLLFFCNRGCKSRWASRLNASTSTTLSISSI